LNGFFKEISGDPRVTPDEDLIDLPKFFNSLREKVYKNDYYPSNRLIPEAERNPESFKPFDSRERETLESRNDLDFIAPDDGDVGGNLQHAQIDMNLFGAGDADDRDEARLVVAKLRENREYEMPAKRNHSVSVRSLYSHL